jgi:enediyne biosynthesis protein E4
VSATRGWLRRQLPGFLALAIMASVYLVARPPSTSAAEIDNMAAKFRFTPMEIAMPPGLPQHSIRQVNKKYRNIDAWISSVGAAIAMNDLDGDGLSNDLCIVDTRTDRVVVTPTPGAGSTRYAPFALTYGALPMSDTIAPMGCVPGDYNEDGREDLMVYFWGRTPILFLTRADGSGLSNASYQPTELVPNASGPRYRGALWNTNSATVGDFDGDGHADIYIGNYFPDGPVLDPTAGNGVTMNRSLSTALNGGEDHIFRFRSGSAGDAPSARYERVDDALPTEVSRGWTLGSSATDLDGDSLPELYLANDFGPDRLLYNESTPGHIRFHLVEAIRTPLVPKSKVLGHDSFKGMGVDFGDLDGDGLYDAFVSNITTSFGIEESNFAFINTARDQSDVRYQMADGRAPFADRSAPMDVAWSGWGWDVKIADFNNSGNVDIAQATGFVKGTVNRWPQLQEMATSNDDLTANPFWWPHLAAGDDVAGNQTLAFFVKDPRSDRYVNLSAKLGLAVPVPTRGVATGDVDGDGLLDFAVARQWDKPIFYHNDSPAPGAFLGLRLTRDAAPAPGSMPAPGTPVIGAEVSVRLPDGRTLVQRVDGGSGHAGKRSHEVHIGLGDGVTAPVPVHLQWRDAEGQVQQADLTLTPGWHDIQLGSQAHER